MIDTLILAFVSVVMLLSVIMILMMMRVTYKINKEEEINEFERAKRELLSRATVLSDEHQEQIVDTIIHCSRNRIGMSLIIEGATPLRDIEETGDNFGIGILSRNLLLTLVESDLMNKGSILIRRDYVVAYNCLMPMVENTKLISAGVGNRGLGAYGTILSDDQVVVILVSGDTGKISFYGHMGEKLSIDIGLGLKEFSIRDGVGFDEIKLRLDSLMKHQGIIASLESKEIKEEIERRKETRDEKRERIKREREERRLAKKQEAERKKKESEMKRLEKQKRKRGVIYDPKKKGDKG